MTNNLNICCGNAGEAFLVNPPVVFKIVNPPKGNILVLLWTLPRADTLISGTLYILYIYEYFQCDFVAVNCIYSPFIFRNIYIYIYRVRAVLTPVFESRL